ncbi:MAG: NAD(P)/FAD-dependent oxidoreductase, partial [Candidatus Aenigmarchaeota archaeon]|nr:NAD(P)/FAD-dependent oxidoreductase [Candidatus Aenigmarchaeota archaeon]
MDYDILIIGAGPAGSSLACKLRSLGLTVLLIDKKAAIGKHACSGLFSKRITKYFDINSSMIENTIKGATFHTRNTSFEIKKEKAEALVIDRPRFDRFVLKKATDSGAHTLLNSHIISCRSTKESIRTHIMTPKGPQEITTKLIIGADGAASTLRRTLNLKGNLNYVNGILSYYPIKNTSELVELYYSPDTAP